MTQENPDDLISRNLTGESTAEEDIALWNWIALDSENQQAFDDAVTLYCNQSGIISDHEIEKRLGKLAGKPVHVQSAWWSIAASLILVAILSALIISLDDCIYIEAARGKIKHITLPDLSQVWLNGGSRISYNEGSYFKSRKIFLEGEAYFQAEFSTTEFIVEYDSVRVSLSSGEINIQAYPGDEEKICVIRDGVATFNDLRKGNLEFVATTDEEVISRAHYGLVSLSINQNLNFNSWVTGLYAFEDVPMMAVFSMVKKGNELPLPKLPDELKRKPVSGVFTFNGSAKTRKKFLSEVLENANRPPAKQL